jgi:hypothetical protein
MVGLHKHHQPEVTIMPNLKMFLHIKKLLTTFGEDSPPLTTLALLVTGMLFGAILPLRWYTVKRKKGHLKEQIQQELLTEVWPTSVITGGLSCWETLNSAMNGLSTGCGWQVGILSFASNTAINPG